MEYRMTQPQRDLIETLRVQMNISADVLDQLCQRFYERRVADLSIRQASALIDEMKKKTEIQREIAILAGQQSLFEVMS